MGSGLNIPLCNGTALHASSELSELSHLLKSPNKTRGYICNTGHTANTHTPTVLLHYVRAATLHAQRTTCDVEM